MQKFIRILRPTSQRMGREPYTLQIQPGVYPTQHGNFLVNGSNLQKGVHHSLFHKQQSNLLKKNETHCKFVNNTPLLCCASYSHTVTSLWNYLMYSKALEMSLIRPIVCYKRATLLLNTYRKLHLEAIQIEVMFHMSIKCCTLAGN